MGARLLTFAAATVVDFLNEEGEESQEAAHAQDGKMAQQVLHPANNWLKSLLNACCVPFESS